MRFSSSARTAAIALAVAAFSGIAAPASAHHGWSSYSSEEFSLTGKVQSASLGNPHGLIKLVDAKGRVWDVVLGPPAKNDRAGLTTAALPAGATVTARGHRHTDPDRLEMKTERLQVGPKLYDIYPDRM